jgi:hypothetical protein
MDDVMEHVDARVWEFRTIGYMKLKEAKHIFS